MANEDSTESVRISGHVMDMIREIAKAERRTFSGQLELLVMAGIKARGQK